MVDQVREAAAVPERGGEDILPASPGSEAGYRFMSAQEKVRTGSYPNLTITSYGAQLLSANRNEKKRLEARRMQPQRSVQRAADTAQRCLDDVAECCLDARYRDTAQQSRLVAAAPDLADPIRRLFATRSDMLAADRRLCALAFSTPTGCVCGRRRREATEPQLLTRGTTPTRRGRPAPVEGLPFWLTAGDRSGLLPRVSRPLATTELVARGRVCTFRPRRGPAQPIIRWGCGPVRPRPPE
ncbi:hypothetical protein [Streptomyces gobiensis]|uniref:hypothetical protein n=1 Tax=Streptomyces gobiensis TaxID=2875706 RepID=UPI001E4ACCB4|nr:hypothetical protein [Streptomyces gobiensis]UGY92083.1 hypothetical protein test1122_10345 [Streptomyces gobiensis]